MSDTRILSRILAARDSSLEAQMRSVPLSQMRGRALQRVGQRMNFRPFAEALRERSQSGECAVVAEIKKASPSAGILCPDYAPAEIARRYERGGACCLSVLTERDFFFGAPEHLDAARSATRLPVLRKDFLFHEYQVEESAALGADCILLIVSLFTGRHARFEQHRLQNLAALARERGMDVLAEVHDEKELDVALLTQANILGINNRNLDTLETSLSVTCSLLRAVPEDRLVISESGIHSSKDVQLLRSSGVHCFLIGEALLRASDPEQRLRELCGLSA